MLPVTHETHELEACPQLGLKYLVSFHWWTLIFHFTAIVNIFLCRRRNLWPLLFPHTGILHEARSVCSVNTVTLSVSERLCFLGSIHHLLVLQSLPPPLHMCVLTHICVNIFICINHICKYIHIYLNIEEKGLMKILHLWLNAPKSLTHWACPGMGLSGSSVLPENLLWCEINNALIYG